ncbi:MAG: DUF499 domain-containing protein [Halobacteriota archaeon]
MREDDDSLTAPAVESIREVLKGKRVIILIDELIDYAGNLRRGGNETERRYTENIPAFLDRLSTALVGTNSVMIVSLPIEVEEGKIQRVEERYDKEYLQKFLEVLNNAIRRVGSVSLAPLRKHEKGDDIVEVMKKRIFEEVPEEVRSKALREIEITIKTNPEVFGPSRVDEIRLTYPYHPELIEILEEIIKRAKLQKTRDMLKYARVIVRGIWTTEENPFLVMPWHINLFDDRIVKSFFYPPFDSYAKVVEKDVVENTQKFSKPELVKLISTAVLLKTYVYDSPIPLHGFPRLFNIANMIYEPHKFMKNNWNPSDIPEALEEVSSSPNMIFLNEKDGVFWFWRIANVNEQIDSEMERVKSEEQDRILSELKKFVEALTFGKRPPRKGKPAKVTPIEVKIFKKQNFKVTSDPEVEIPNDDAYKLVIYVAESIADDELYSLIYRYREGERRFKNTVVVMSPVSSTASTAFRKCEGLTARLLACEAVAEKLNEIYAGMPDEVKSIQKSLIDKIKRATETEIQDAILSAFRKIAYPKFEYGRQSIGDAQSSETAVSLVEHAYLALTQPLTGKIIEEKELSYDALERYVEDVMRIELGESANHSIGTIRDWFRTNPALPMVEDDAILDAIVRGARRLKIGISNGGVWFKPVHNEPPETGMSDEGVVPLLKNEYKVLSWREALENQVKALISQEGEKREGNKVIKKYYEVYYEEAPYRLREVVESHPDDWLDLVKEGFIVERTEIIEHGFDVALTPSFIEVEEGKSVEIKVDVGSYLEPLSVRVSVEQGTVEPGEEGITPFSAVWRLDAKRDEKVELVVEALGICKSVPLIIRIKKGVIRKHALSNKDVGKTLVGIEEIKSSEHLKAIAEGIEAGNGCIGSFAIESEEHGKVEAKIERVDSKTAEYMVSEIEGILGAKARMDVKVFFEEVSVSEIVFQKLKMLNNSVIFEIKESSK